MSDETKTPAARLIESRKAVQGLAEKAVTRLDAARTKADAALKAIARETSAPTPAINQAEIQHDGEVRAVLRGMSEKDRNAAIAQALQDNNESIIRAVLNGSSLLSGLSSRELEMRRHSWRVKKFPTETDREVRLKKAVAALDTAGGSLVSWIASLSETSAAKLAEASAKRAAEAAAAAQAAE